MTIETCETCILSKYKSPIKVFNHFYENHYNDEKQCISCGKMRNIITYNMILNEECKICTPKNVCSKCNNKFTKYYIGYHEVNCKGICDKSIKKCRQCLKDKNSETEFYPRRADCIECTKKLKNLHHKNV